MKLNIELNLKRQVIPSGLIYQISTESCISIYQFVLTPDYSCSTYSFNTELVCLGIDLSLMAEISLVKDFIEEKHAWSSESTLSKYVVSQQFVCTASSCGYGNQCAQENPFSVDWYRWENELEQSEFFLRRPPRTEAAICYPFCKSPGHTIQIKKSKLYFLDPLVHSNILFNFLMFFMFYNLFNIHRTWDFKISSLC